MPEGGQVTTTTKGFSRREAHFHDEVRNDGGAAETMDEVGAAATFAEGATLLPLAKEASPPRGPGARGMKSARAARPGPEEVRNSGDKPDRRMASTLRLPAPLLPASWS